jgi:hypothetical protein
LGPFELGSGQLPPCSDGPLGRDGQASVERARTSAAERLKSWLPAPVVESLGGYFEDAAVHRHPHPIAAATPTFELDSFLYRLCGTPRTVYSVGGESGAAQVELRTLHGPNDGAEFGAQTEPGSPRILFSPSRLAQALSEGLSLGVRQFDRQFNEWAPIIDDVAAVSGGDIFTKLFVAGGKESVTDWHRDQSDVVVTMLSGTKQFDVAPATAGDDDDWSIEVGAKLRSDTALLLPRSRAHCATPTGDTSALLSIGIMRHADWAFRSVVPTHLGFTSPPRSTTAYRLMLRPHTPATPVSRDINAAQRWRSRMPGGMLVTYEAGDSAEIVALGLRLHLRRAAARALFEIHGAGVKSTGEIAQSGSISASTCEEVLRSLVAAELIAAC